MPHIRLLRQMLQSWWWTDRQRRHKVAMSASHESWARCRRLTWADLPRIFHLLAARSADASSPFFLLRRRRLKISAQKHCAPVLGVHFSKAGFGAAKMHSSRLSSIGRCNVREGRIRFSVGLFSCFLGARSHHDVVTARGEEECDTR